MARPPLSLPVHIEPSMSDVMQGTFEIEGLLRLDLDEGTLTLEYQTNSSFLGSKTVHTATFSVDDVSKAESRRGFFRGRLTLFPARLAAFDGVPGLDAGRVVLRVRRTHLDTLAQFDRQLQAAHLFPAEQEPSHPADASLPALPFEIRAVHAGFSRASGMLSFDGDFVVLDVQVTALGFVKHEPFQVRVERSVIRDARLARRLRRDRLYLTPKKFELLAAMPGRHRDDLRLDVRSEHRDLAERVVAALNYPV